MPFAYAPKASWAIKDAKCGTCCAYYETYDELEVHITQKRHFRVTMAKRPGARAGRGVNKRRRSESPVDDHEADDDASGSDEPAALGADELPEDSSDEDESSDAAPDDDKDDDADTQPAAADAATKPSVDTKALRLAAEQERAIASALSFAREHSTVGGAGGVAAGAGTGAVAQRAMAKGERRTLAEVYGSKGHAEAYVHFFEERGKGDASRMVHCVHCLTPFSFNGKNPLANLNRHLKSCEDMRRFDEGKSVQQSLLGMNAVRAVAAKLPRLEEKYHAEARNALAEFVITTASPFRFFETDGAKRMFDRLLPGLPLPGRNFVTHYLSTSYDDVIAVFARLMEDHADYKCLMFDGWSDLSVKNFLGVAVSFITRPPELERVQLHIGFRRIEGSHTAERIRDDIIEIVNRYKCRRAVR